MNLHESDLIRHAKADGFAEGELRGKEIGLAEGERKKTVEMARKLISKSYPIEEIAECTGLSIDEIKKLEEEEIQKQA